MNPRCELCGIRTDDYFNQTWSSRERVSSSALERERFVGVGVSLTLCRRCLPTIRRLDRVMRSIKAAEAAR